MPTPPPPHNPIQTHHCLCSNLLLATTYAIPSLARRDPPSLDNAFILPCPRLPSRLLHSSTSTTTTDSASSGSSDSDSSPETEDAAATQQKRSRDFTLLIGVGAVGRQQPVLVRREDGLEKRWLVRCARCKLVVGYRLDWRQFTGAGVGGDGEGAEVGNAGEGDGGGREVRTGRRDDVLYLLPGALVTTEDMKAGKAVGEEEVGFGLVES